MLKLIDKLFKSDLVEYPNRIHLVISVIIVIAVWVLSIMIFYYSLPIDTKGAAEYFIHDKAGIGFGGESKKIVGYYNTYYSFSKEQPQIVIYTDNESISDSEIDKKANDIFNEIGIGSSKYNNGVLIYLSTKPYNKIRVEVGYGLEDVINDAKAGRLIDSKIELIGNSKPLTDFSRTQLERLSIALFIDINKIIAKKYNIQFPTSKITSQIYYYENQRIHILILITLLLILYVRCLKYRYVYVLVFVPFLIINIILLLIGVILFLLDSITSIFGIYIFNLLGKLASMTGFSSELALALMLIFVLIFVTFPFVINILLYTTETDNTLLKINSKRMKKKVENNSNNSISVMPYAKALLTDTFVSPNKSFYKNLSHRFLLNYIVIFMSLYMFMYYMIDKYGYTIQVILLIIVITSISLYLLLVKRQYGVPVTYAGYMSISIALLLDFDLVYGAFFALAPYFLFLFNIGFGIVPGNYGKGSTRYRSRRLRRGGSSSSSSGGGFSFGGRSGSFKGGGRSGGGGAKR